MGQQQESPALDLRDTRVRQLCVCLYCVTFPRRPRQIIKRIGEREENAIRVMNSNIPKAKWSDEEELETNETVKLLEASNPESW